VALFVALGGGAVAYAAGVINGSQIKNHSIAAKKLTSSAIKSLHGQTGPAGPPGPQGVPGPQGTEGTILAYDANAVTGSPTPTTVGTVLGDTYGATCTSSSGSASFRLYLQTTDGSWTADFDSITHNSIDQILADAYHTNQPAGGLSTPQIVDALIADSGGHQADRQVDFVQLSPSPGLVTWHETAITTTAPSATCHLSIQAIPESLTAVHGTPHAGPGVISHLPIHTH